jgi:predicted nucleotidyltransferase
MGITKAKAKSARNPTRAPSVSTRSLADALFTATQQRLLGLLFGQPERSFFVTELITLADVGRGAVQRELARLEQARLVLTERHGNQKHYRANPAAPIFEELCAIVRKTVGIEEQVRVALAPLEQQIALALIYGSVAKQADTAESDIDLLVVADDLTLEDLYSRFAPVETQLGRTINPTLYTREEFASRRAADNPFLKRVLGGAFAVLQGELDAA